MHNGYAIMPRTRYESLKDFVLENKQWAISTLDHKQDQQDTGPVASGHVITLCGISTQL